MVIAAGWLGGWASGARVAREQVGYHATVCGGAGVLSTEEERRLLELHWKSGQNRIAPVAVHNREESNQPPMTSSC